MASHFPSWKANLSSPSLSSAGVDGVVPAVMDWPEGAVAPALMAGMRACPPGGLSLLTLSLLLTCVSSLSQPLPRVFLPFEGKTTFISCYCLGEQIAK